MLYEVITIDRWNLLNKNVSDSRIVSELENIKKEYFIWLHFRLLFNFIDILGSYPSNKIYNQDTLNRYKKLAGSVWYEK